MTLPSESLGGGDEEETGSAPATAVAVLPPPPAKRLADLVRRPFGEDPNELLRNRFLCRRGGGLFVGPSGIGKSSLAMQAMILWALGRPFFRITPTGPLKSLLIQAENDDGDLAEMRDGVIAGLGLSPVEQAQALANVIVVQEDTRTASTFCDQVVRPLLEKHRPDLLWIDPALAYLGGDTNSQKDVGYFLRACLNPLLRAFHCGAIVIHHTNKPINGIEKSTWSAGDFAYLGAGSAEWANWARCVLGIRSLGSHEIFQLVAGKRGSRLGWTEADGITKKYSLQIAHAKEPGVICWREVGAEEQAAMAPPAKDQKKIHTKADVLPHVPSDKPIEKIALRSKCHGAGIALNRINGLIAELIHEGVLHEWNQQRSRTNPAKFLARFPQPAPDPQASLPTLPETPTTDPHG